MRRRLTKSSRTLQGRMLEQQDALDELMRDLGLGVRSADHYDDLESRVDEICTGMRAAFRECRIERA